MTEVCAEFALLAACCRPPTDGARAATIAAAAARPLDWARFERLVVRHRVAALAANGLSACPAAPAPVRARLSAAAVAGAAGTLAMAAEALRLQSLFDGAGLPAYVVKGIPLARLAYGNIALKHARDIDLVVPRAHLRAAAALLEDAGYAAAEGEAPLTDAEMALLDTFAKHRAFRHSTSGHLVELHFRLHRNPAALAAWGEQPPLQAVPLGGGVVRTLAPEALYTYLCVHGGGHAWERLKWLADLVALIGATGADVAALHDGARALGAGRASAVALALGHAFLGLSVPEAVLRQARGPLAARLLLAFSRAALLEEREDLSQMEGIIFQRRASRVLLLQGGGYARKELVSLFVSEADARALHLAPSLHFLYPLLRVPRALGRVVRRRAGG
ncbi:nucleotidyltransferase family protein [Aquabacter cavernae]|uniref:nucleotidyltransferase family protein n=1 Tax=Aquabacter cavernae TaxID=2496029 RepID=UPI0013E05123|nr:nucleotidyltransferase family protein [Aquabacter cavernae]